LVNFLQIKIGRPFRSLRAETQVFSFDLTNCKNKLLDVYPDAQYARHKSFIGKFAGREECVFQMEGKGLFFFVIEGAFEVQYRLLEARDGLALWNVRSVEIEALSKDAIILLLELPFPMEPYLPA
jgi:quercetin 2,3-dioxygenase